LKVLGAWKRGGKSVLGGGGTTYEKGRDLVFGKKGRVSKKKGVSCQGGKKTTLGYDNKNKEGILGKKGGRGKRVIGKTTLPASSVRKGKFKKGKKGETGNLCGLIGGKGNAENEERNPRGKGSCVWGGGMSGRKGFPWGAKATLKGAPTGQQVVARGFVPRGGLRKEEGRAEPKRKKIAKGVQTGQEKRGLQDGVLDTRGRIGGVVWGKRFSPEDVRGAPQKKNKGGGPWSRKLPWGGGSGWKKKKSQEEKI